MSDAVPVPGGLLLVGGRNEVFARAAALVTEAAAAGRPARVALSGGSTPVAWYRWLVEGGALPESATAGGGVQWYTSDERCVPLESAESNFGNAERGLLSPLGVPAACRFPWPVGEGVDPTVGALDFNRAWAARGADADGGDDGGGGGSAVFDLCFLGMGDDAHTASLFPGSPLLAGVGVGAGGEGLDADGDPFAAVEVPGKGWRYTITVPGLARCRRIVVMVAGAGKAAALAAVLRGEVDPRARPAQVLRDLPSDAEGRRAEVLWLVDEAAASGLR